MHPATDDPDGPDWQRMLSEATRQIDLLDETLIHILGTEGVPDLLAEKAAAGCQIRILIADPGSYWINHREGIHRPADADADPDEDEEREEENERKAEAKADAWQNDHDHALAHLQPLTGQPGIEIREYAAARFNTILRIDDQMLVTLYLWAQSRLQAPLLHLRRQTQNGLFDKFAQHYDALWQDASQPANLDLGEEQGRTEPTVDGPSHRNKSASESHQPASPLSEPSRPRRWPRRAP